MMSLRNLVAALFCAGVFAPAGAQAQYYYTQSPAPPPAFGRVIVTDTPVPPDLGRPYPYATSNPGYVSPQYPQAQPEWRRKRAPKPALSQARRTHQAQLIEELKKRPRIKKVTVEETAATAATPLAVAPRGKRAMLEKDGARVIRAEAEVRIMGNDQMSIRLYRKGQSPRAEAE
jgi:hypothetical protein